MSADICLVGDGGTSRDGKVLLSRSEMAFETILYSSNARSLIEGSGSVRREVISSSIYYGAKSVAAGGITVNRPDERRSTRSTHSAKRLSLLVV